LPPFLSKHPKICLREVGLILVLTGPLGGGLAHCGLVTKLSTARPPGLDCLQLLLGDGRFFGLVPVGGGDTYGFAGMVSDRLEDPAEGRLQRFQERFADFGGLVPGYRTA
jgi:hypothetical protein